MSEPEPKGTIKVYVCNAKDGSLVDVETLTEEQKKKLATGIETIFRGTAAWRTLWQNTTGKMATAIKRGED